MKTITIKQPWAALIVHGIKDIENRTWQTKFRGRILIHAGKSSDGKLNDLLKPVQKYAAIDNNWNQSEIYFPFGAIIGSVEIVDCVINHASVWAEKSDAEFKGHDEQGRELWDQNKPIYNWVLANPILFEKPINNVKGKLSFWDYPNIHSEMNDEKPVCMCQLPVDEVDQVRVIDSGIFECKYCNGKWYK